FDGHPSVMMRFLRNIEGMGPHMRYLWYASSLRVGNMSKYYTSNPPALGSSLCESSFFLTISMNITSPSSHLVQTNSMSDNWGAKLSDSKNELSLRTFSVMNETDGSGDVEGLVLVFSGLSFSFSSLFVGSSSWESLCCLGWIMTALIKPWIWVEHCGSSVWRCSCDSICDGFQHCVNFVGHLALLLFEIGFKLGKSSVLKCHEVGHQSFKI
ncbi:hypothetical protein Tco_0844463, partial [Tanacetum coccineum]